MNDLVKQLLTEDWDKLSPEDRAEVDLIIAMLRNKSMELTTTTEVAGEAFWHYMKFVGGFDDPLRLRQRYDKYLDRLDIIRPIMDKFDYNFSAGNMYFWKEYSKPQNPSLQLLVCFDIDY